MADEHEPCEDCGRPMQFDEGWFCTGSVSCGVDLVTERDRLREALATLTMLEQSWHKRPPEPGDESVWAEAWDDARAALGWNADSTTEEPT